MLSWRFLVMSGAVLLAACQPDIDDGQVLARVNGNEISVHQFNFALSQAPQPRSQADRSALLDKLIDRQLVVQRALENRLDRRPDVMMRLEEARRDILAAAQATELSAASPAPTDADVAHFYRDHPALFSQRKLYRLHEVSLASDAPAWPELQQRMEQQPDLTELLAWLRQRPGANDQMLVRPAEQLPIEMADRMLRVAPGELVAFRLPRGLIIYQMLSAEAAPIAWAAAAPVIREHLQKRRDAESLSQALAELRAQSRIERRALP